MDTGVTSASAELPQIPETADAMRGGPLERRVVDADVWDAIGQHLGAERRFTLVSLWAEPDRVHLALLDEAGPRLSVFTLPCPERRFPSVGRYHAPAIRLERAVQDLYGLTPIATPDARPWLDHGRWGRVQPLAEVPVAGRSDPYVFREAQGEALHQIPVGPVHAGIIEPGHFRFTATGETIVRLEERLGYVHKGIDGLMAGATIARAAQLAARTSGDSTVAYSLAFARAVESALGVEVPARGCWLRALMAELERIANHLGDFGAICNDASFSILHAHCGILRERVLRAAATAFGHRLMMDSVTPGGVRDDIEDSGVTALRAALSEIRARLPELVELYDNTASLQDRTAGTGVLPGELAQRFGAGGYVGRASGRAIDVRKLWAYPPYDRLDFAVPVLSAGDVNARVWIRIDEIGASLTLIERLLDELPDGASRTALPVAAAGAHEGIAAVEGFRGDIFVWVRVEDGRIARSHLRDPSWFLWPLLEAVVEGNIVADFPLCNKSFNCSYSGHDL
jgi:Ni,Fe-hydrogenase III large subunit/Ni,Fe-hydrogenase III component G